MFSFQSSKFTCSIEAVTAVIMKDCASWDITPYVSSVCWATCFILVSHLVYSWTLKTKVMFSPKRRWFSTDYNALYPRIRTLGNLLSIYLQWNYYVRGWGLAPANAPDRVGFILLSDGESMTASGMCCVSWTETRWWKNLSECDSVHWASQIKSTASPSSIITIKFIILTSRLEFPFWFWA